MDKEIYQDVMWLFHDLGRHLRLVVREAPSDWDTRGLLRNLVQDHQPTIVGGRNPFNWMKELQTASNFWHHLGPESDIPEDDIWRDLDTLERVAKYLGIASDFIEGVRQVKERIWAEKDLEGGRPGEIDLRSWIAEEVDRQLKAVNSKVGLPAAGTEERRGEDRSEKHRGEYADRVRDFVIDTYIVPARTEGQKRVTVRAGDVDKALGYRYRRLPLICGALRSQKFMEAACVKLIGEEGPPSGASTTTTFTYELESTCGG